jgi:hypothetical protein
MRMPELSRRGLITGLICLMAAPAIVRAASLMPVKAMPVYTDLERLWLEIRHEGHFSFSEPADLTPLPGHDDKLNTRLRILKHDQYRCHDGLITSKNTAVVSGSRGISAPMAG